MRKKKGNEKFLKFDEIFEEVKSVITTKKKLDAIIANLEKDSKIFT
jgi:hypothetical protein